MQTQLVNQCLGKLLIHHPPALTAATKANWHGLQRFKCWTVLAGIKEKSSEAITEVKSNVYLALYFEANR